MVSEKLEQLHDKLDRIHEAIASLIFMGGDSLDTNKQIDQLNDQADAVEREIDKESTNNASPGSPPDQLSGNGIHCPKCGSSDWRCYNETTRPCYDANGDYVGDRVIGGLACNTCGADWLDYSVDPQLDDPDCECEDY